MDAELFQPGLFSPENIALGEAREAMEALHFDQAAGLYRSIRARWPELNEEAREGLELALKWGAFFGDRESGASVEGFGGRLFAELQSPHGSRLPGGLRTALLEHCLRLLGQEEKEDLRYGECLLLLDRPEDAFLWAEDASFPDSDLQYRFFLARTAWKSGRRRLARRMWARLILEGLESGEEILDPRFRELILEFGAVPALWEGWFRKDLDLLPLEEIPRTKRAEAYLRLCEVEAIRGKADWDSLLEARKGLGEIAPELLKRYILFLEGR